MKTIIIFFLLCCTTNRLMAQHIRFTTEGVIKYEKRINMFAIIKRSINKANETFMNQAYDQFKKTQPQFKVLKSSLSFSKFNSLYIPQEEQVAGGPFGTFPGISQPNIIHTDYLNRINIIQKNVFEETFLVKDTLRKITWKITDEIREIAGYTCRRANALVLDSVYVVAFYTDRIPVSGGPESFSGLPGMILGVALPHENITWFATSVSEKPVNVLKAPVKGKPIDREGLIKTLESALKQWGEYAKIAIKAYLL